MDPFTIAAGILSTATGLYDLYTKIKAASLQSGESTPEQWADYDKQWSATLQGSEWQPDSPK